MALSDVAGWLSKCLRNVWRKQSACNQRRMNKRRKSGFKELTFSSVEEMCLSEQPDNVLLWQLSVNALSSFICSFSSLSVNPMSFYCNLSLCVHPYPPPPCSFMFNCSYYIFLSGWTHVWASKYCEKGPPLLMSLHKRVNLWVGSVTVEWREAQRESKHCSHTFNEPPVLMTLCKMANLWVGS